MTKKNTIIKTKINGEIVELIPKTDADNVYVDDDTTLATKLNEIGKDDHSHSNKSELDKITEGDVEKWNGKPNVYVQSDTPAELKTNDIWMQLVE